MEEEETRGGAVAGRHLQHGVPRLHLRLERVEFLELRLVLVDGLAQQLDALEEQAVLLRELRRVLLLLAVGGVGRA